MPDSPDLRLAPGLTIDCWVYFDEKPTGYQPIVIKGNEYQLRLDDQREGGRFSFFVYLDGWEPRVSTTVPVAGKWYHLTAKWTGTEISLTVNDERVSSERFGTPQPTDNPLVIGKANCRIDELKLRNPSLEKTRQMLQMIQGTRGRGARQPAAVRVRRRVAGLARSVSRTGVTTRRRIGRRIGRRERDAVEPRARRGRRTEHVGVGALAVAAGDTGQPDLCHRGGLGHGGAAGVGLPTDVSGEPGIPPGLARQAEAVGAVVPRRRRAAGDDRGAVGVEQAGGTPVPVRPQLGAGASHSAPAATSRSSPSSATWAPKPRTCAPSCASPPACGLWESRRSASTRCRTTPPNGSSGRCAPSSRTWGRWNCL